MINHPYPLTDPIKKQKANSRNIEVAINISKVKFIAKKFHKLNGEGSPKKSSLY